jgi:hypothetical protein
VASARLWRGLGYDPAILLRPEKGLGQVSQAKDVHEAVEKELSFDPVVDSRNITVRNINGDVVLAGTVASYPQYLEATAADGDITLTGPSQDIWLAPATLMRPSFWPRD